MKKLNKVTGGFLILLLFMGILSGCASKKTKWNGWHIIPNAKNAVLSITQKDLGVVVKDVHLMLQDENGKTNPLLQWKIKEKGNQLTIITQQPKQTTWTFTTSKRGINIHCSVSHAVLTGLAPASEERIAARTKGQDNGVIYTALGLISAGNIHDLFDRKTDILIQFSPKSILTRNKKNDKLMNLAIPVTNGNEISIIPNYYNDVVGLSLHAKTKFKPVYKPIPQRFKTAPAGWSSWYCYYMTTTQADMVKETNALARLLKPYGLQYVQLDACYTRGKNANWLDWNKKAFPKGGKWLFHYILNKGLKPGLWLNAFGDDYAKPSMAKKYPENFFLRDKNGKLSGACCSADTTVVRLDFTNPEVTKKYLIPLFDTLVNNWGLKYLKAGGWGTWMNYYEKNRDQAYDSTKNSRAVYRGVLQVIRKIMGNDNYMLGCEMHEVGCGFGIFDGSRTGGDDLAQWYPSKESSMSMQTFFSSLFGANYLNGICWWSDPDAVQVRPPLTMNEAKTIVTTISLSGQAYIISDFLTVPPPKGRFKSLIHQKIDTKLPSRRLMLYQQTLPTMPIHAVDLYPFRCKAVVCPHPSSFPKALDMKVNAVSGSYDVTALYNWKNTPDKKGLYFVKDLGLYAGRKYVLFDFWSKQLLGVYTDSINLDVPAHGVRALIIKPLTGNPLLLATSRHISGAYSIKKLDWNNPAHTLTGVSKTVPGAPYSIYIYVPERFTFTNVKTNAKLVSKSISGRLLKITLQGQEKPVRWSLFFSL